MSCSATLSRALHRFAFYCRLISDSATATLTESGEQVTLAIFFDTGGAPPIYQTVDTVLAAVLGYPRWIAGIQITPIVISLAPPKPHESDGLRSEDHTPEIQTLTRIPCDPFVVNVLTHPFPYSGLSDVSRCFCCPAVFVLGEGTAHRVARAGHARNLFRYRRGPADLSDGRHGARVGARLSPLDRGNPDHTDRSQPCASETARERRARSLLRLPGRLRAAR